MKRLAALLVLIALAVAGCAPARTPQYSAAASDDPDAPPVVENEPPVKLPPPPKDQDLLRFDVQPRTSLEYFVDSASISLPGDEIVRFTVVARSATAENVSYEGFRCIAREYKVYARTNRSGAWVTAKEAAWIPVGARTAAGFRNELFWNYFCPAKRIIASPREGADALRYGGHRDARPEAGTVN